MKKSILTFSLLITLFFTVSAQRWERDNDRRNYDHSTNRVIYNHENYRRGYDRDDKWEYERNNYYRGERREYYREEPIVFYHRDYCPPQRVTYFYYPSANVYYNPYNRLFIYPCHGEWVNASALPYGFYINEPAREVYCNDNENIVAYNNLHINSFRPYVDVRRCAPIQFRIGFRL